MTDFRYVYEGETIEFEHNGQAFIATIERDDFTGAPWDEHDGHGNVSDWTRRAKEPGELVLNEDRGSHRYYDFAGACKTALRDGWGGLPEPVRVERPSRGGMTGAALPTYHSGGFSIVSDCPNEARAELYRMHQESMTPRAYAAMAARADYERLRAWCADQWFWCGVVVRRKGACECCGETASLWGIESDAGEYLGEVARELASELG